MAGVSLSSRVGWRSHAVVDLAIASAATLAFVAFHALRGFPTLADSAGDNDSLLRLVQVRDLLGGQGWFDPFQYRMGLEGGFAMHWSRLVDFPIALLVSAFGETATLIVWPSLLFALCLFAVVRTARLLGGSEAVLPALVTGALSFHFVNVFVPGALDHHNAQLALVLFAAYALAASSRQDADSPTCGGVVAGCCSALMLAIGMEAAPYAGAACLLAVVCFLFGDGAGARIARGFGVGFASMAAAAFFATVPGREWMAVHCDALSLPQGSLAVLGGGGLALIASVPALSRDIKAKMARLLGLGVVAVILAAAGFPQCLGDPYRDLDPMLKLYWLSAVTEAQSFADLVRNADLGTLAGYYATPVIALVVLAIRTRRSGFSRDEAVIGFFLLVAFLVSLWQVRGGVFSVPLAAILLATWIGRSRVRARDDRRAGAQVVMAVAWLASFSFVWQFAVISLSALLSAGNSSPAAEAVNGEDTCYSLADYGLLARLPAGTVLTISNLGSSVLHQTQHRVLNGPYHRNNDGNRAALDILMGAPGDAETTARDIGIDYVVLCRGNSETTAIANWAPEGFLAALMNGPAPRWLTPVEGSQGAALEIFRVVPQ